MVESKLKVMLEEDYLALNKGCVETGHCPVSTKQTNNLGSQIVREVIIPQLTKEINQGQNFAQLRQVYNSLILATWYKKKIKDSILSQVYVDKNKVAGILSSQNVPTLADGRSVSRRSEATVGTLIGDPQHIYQQYLQSFKKGAYNYIKEEQDPITQQPIPRKYFSGGAVLIDLAMSINQDINIVPASNDSTQVISVQVTDIPPTHNSARSIRYATQAERDQIFTQIRNSFERGASKYVADLIENIKKIDPDEAVGLLPQWVNEGATQNAVFHRGLVKSVDASGREVFWILRRFTGTFQKLASLIGQTEAAAINFSEIRFLKDEEVNILRLGGARNEYYLDRVVMDDDDLKSQLPDQTWETAFSSLFVARIFMGKKDPHLWNLGFVDGVPVSIDNENILYDNRSDFDQIETHHVSHVDTFIKKETQRTINRTVLSRAVVATEGLDEDLIKSAILRLKKIDVKKIVTEAGFDGVKAIEVTKVLKSNQRHLGQYVDEYWKLLTGKEGGFTKLDAAMTIGQATDTGRYKTKIGGGLENLFKQAESAVNKLDRGSQWRDAYQEAKDIIEVLEDMDMEPGMIIKYQQEAWVFMEAVLAHTFLSWLGQEGHLKSNSEARALFFEIYKEFESEIERYLINIIKSRSDDPDKYEFSNEYNQNQYVREVGERLFQIEAENSLLHLHRFGYESFAPKRDAKDVLKIGKGVVNAGVNSWMNMSGFSLARLSSRRQDMNLILMSKISDISFESIVENDCPLVKAGIIFHDHKPYFVKFDDPLPLDYLANYSVGLESNLSTLSLMGKLPLAAHPLVEQYLEEKDITDWIISQEKGKVLVPKRLVFLAEPSEFDFINKYRTEAIRHGVAVDMVNDNNMYMNIEKKLNRFLDENHLNEVVVKPNQGARGKGVRFFRNLNSSINRVKAKWHIQSRINLGESVVVQQRIVCNLKENGQAMDINVGVFVSPDKEGKGQARLLVSATIGKFGEVINASQGSEVVTLEEAARRLGIGDQNLKDLKEQSLRMAEQAYDAIYKAMVKDGLVGENGTSADFMRVDIMFNEEDGKLVPYVNEVNGIASGLGWALDQFLEDNGLPGGGEWSQGWLGTMVRRGRNYQNRIGVDATVNHIDPAMSGQMPLQKCDGVERNIKRTHRSMPEVSGMPSIGDRIQSAIKLSFMSQRAYAVAVEISENALSEFLSGKHLPSIKALIRIIDKESLSPRHRIGWLRQWAVEWYKISEWKNSFGVLLMLARLNLGKDRSELVDYLELKSETSIKAYEKNVVPNSKRLSDLVQILRLDRDRLLALREKAIRKEMIGWDEIEELLIKQIGTVKAARQGIVYDGGISKGVQGFDPMPEISGIVEENQNGNSSGSVSNAMRVASPAMAVRRDGVQSLAQKGGIDLAKVKVDSRVRGNDNEDGKGIGIQFHIDPAMVARLRDSVGFEAAIMDMQPMEDVRAFLTGQLNVDRVLTKGRQ